MKKKVVVCSGAGLSVSSGLPTFRCQNGLWEQHDLNKVCNMQTFFQNYIECNEFYAKRREQYKGVTYNEAHKSLALAQKRLENVDIVHITTNVDTLLEASGCVNVTHLHGILTQLRLNYGTEKESIVEDEGIDWTKDKFYPVKPNVVFFGESAPNYQIMYDTFTNLSDCDLIIIVGSSENVVNFSATAKYICQTKAKVVYIDPEPSVHSSADKIVKENSENIDFVKFIKTELDLL